MNVRSLERRLFQHLPRLGSKSRPELARNSRCRYHLAVEDLEGRSLMSVGGSPDLSFGINGVSAFTDVPNSEDAATASARQSDGKLIVVGVVGNFNLAGIIDNYGLVVARYNTNGSLDTTFGTNGYFDSVLLGVPTTPLLPKTATAESVAIQPDGKIVIVGDVGSNAKVVRLDTNGTLDTSFGTSGLLGIDGLLSAYGIVTLGGLDLLAPNSLNYATSVAILPGGQIAVGGAATPLLFGAQSPAVEMLNSDGSLDTAYGTGGVTLFPTPAGASSIVPIIPSFTLLGSFPATSPIGLVAQPNGKVDLQYNVGLGNGQTGIVVSQLNAGGALDTTFGVGGQEVITPQSITSTGVSATGTSLALQPDGKLIVGGSIILAGSSTSHMAVLRLGTNGVLDPTFGLGGANIPGGPTPANSTVGAIALQPDGKIVLADRNNPDFVRLTTSGLPDNSFGTGGTALFPVAQGQTLVGSVGVSIESTGRIIATQAGFSQGLLGMLSQGAEGDYDDDGVSDAAIYITSLGDFAYKASGGGTGALVPIGTAGVGSTLPAPGAYNGGGISEVAVYLPAQGEFVVQPYGGGSEVITPFGTPGAGNSIPAPGDYDDSGKTEYAVYLPNLGAFAYRPANGGADVIVPFGTKGAGNSIPVPADYFGTGQDDIAVYLPNLGAFAIRNPSTGTDQIIGFGMPGAGNSIPVPGDYDGSGKDELAVYVPSLGALIYRPANGGPDVIEPFGIKGAGMSLPAPGDYDGSGKTEVAAYFPTLGLFAYRPANGGPDVIEGFGTPNQTIPFATASATDLGSPGGLVFAKSISPAVEIPLTQDDLDSLSGTSAKKTNKHS